MIPEQSGLLHKAEDSLQAAKLLMQQGFYNFAASRAYYTMFYVAQALLLNKALSFSKHSAVIAAFGQHFCKTGIFPEEFHRYLIEAQESRNVADYDAGPGLTQSQAREQIVRSEKFLQVALQHLSPS